MRKLFICALFFIGILPKAQNYAAINGIIDRLEERKGINQHLENVSIDNKKFVLVKDFEDHTERSFIILKGKDATYVEMFDDKATGKSTSNVFSGDIIRKKNIISLRADKLENKKIPIPVAKTLLLTKQKEIIYLIDINSRERWIDEESYTKKTK
ncbi:hypothetical protein K0U91_02495 [Chryseobacterium chendengshani]|uniref:hypothetical protein n=1 Tax=Chryseobacterium sp. LJ668 TaxID=2864040 RepID=UPI001C68796D|nr:hypothetical protein [Chryseobacterium sp. LJ668]MBW8524088.1 hypothetical protein [Chryseobacterium sp. LJ668]QYK17023.1 hypothetical protein K0U91_02495 [Chryseobacterium sp. LJ668]